MHYNAKITAPGADNKKIRLAVVKQNACINNTMRAKGSQLDNQEIIGKFRFIIRLMF